MNVIDKALAGHRQRLKNEAVMLDSLEVRYRRGERPGLLLKLCREWLEITQQEVADHVGISRSAVLQIERGVYQNQHVWDTAVEFLSSCADESEEFAEDLTPDDEPEF